MRGELQNLEACVAATIFSVVIAIIARSYCIKWYSTITLAIIVYLAITLCLGNMYHMFYWFVIASCILWIVSYAASKPFSDFE